MGIHPWWTSEHAQQIGNLILAYARDSGRGKEDQIDVDLDGRWFRIYSDPTDNRVVIFPIPTPIELVDEVKEG